MTGQGGSENAALTHRVRQLVSGSLFYTTAIVLFAASAFVAEFVTYDVLAMENLCTVDPAQTGTGCFPWPYATLTVLLWIPLITTVFAARRYLDGASLTQ